MVYVHELALRARAPRRIGRKAERLAQLAKLGAPIPRTWVCDWRAHAAWMQGDLRIVELLSSELTGLLSPNGTYAVRSSADTEDGSQRSLAGQFESYLRVRGTDEVLAAVEGVWRSAARSAGSRMGVIIQEMVHAEASGIAFSRNPVTGGDEVVIEAVAGTSEALTSGAVSPERWIVCPDEVPTAGAGVVDGSQLQQIAGAARKWGAALGIPIDLEWAFDGTGLFWLQLRPISTLQSPDIYSNKISREFLPGLIMPLVWSVNVPMVNGAWLSLLEEIIGPIAMDPAELARRIGCRAYFNMGRMGDLFEQAGLRRDVLEAMMGFGDQGEPRRRGRWVTIRVVRHSVRMVRFMARHARFRRIFARRLPLVEQKLRGLADEARAGHTTIEQLERLLNLMKEIAYYRIVSMLRHAAIHRFVAHGLSRRNIPEEQLESLGASTIDSATDPSGHLATLRAMFMALPEGIREKIRVEEDPLAVEEPAAEEFCTTFDGFLQRFGYLSDRGNDFSAETWGENPSLVLNILAAGATATSHAEREDAVGRAVGNPRGVRRLVERELRARSDRDRVGALFSSGHALLRRCFLDLGTRLAQGAILESQTDIFLLTYPEIGEALEGGLVAGVAHRRVDSRRSELQLAADAELPEVVYGDQIPEFRADVPKDSVLVGVPASRGFYEGPARVVRSVEEFGRVRPEDVLVIPHSDIGWMPLLDKASAIVAQSGGMLSHSAIIARERGIPAVVSVLHANRIPDGSWVTVDGNRGTISLSPDPNPVPNSAGG